MEEARLRRKDTTKGPPLRILSLDGGGVRGYSMLIILQELMHRTFVEMEGRAPKRQEIPRPCDHFDLIAGTGTGGLIALMLGRLRLDLDTCKDLYVRMTRRVFETDKTFAGIPFKSTMFKASKLEEVIKECVREHTISEREGNDTLANAAPMSSDTPQGTPMSPNGPNRTSSSSSRYSQVGQSPRGGRPSLGSLQWGNSNTLLYDKRENRTKTALTAVLKGTSHTTLLRSYDSRKEPAPETNCTIWQAGRATSATMMAFKPISIGQSQYLDEGAGKYNPAPTILDEAVQNEWPGREVGVFVSIGTGKRPPNTNSQQHDWWEGFLGGSMGDFAEARRRLISKLEACEDTHQYMLREHLSARGVNVENYCRLNVEVGVGEFGMNEWARLSEISTNTRTYLAKRDVENVNQNAAVRLAKVHFAKIRHDRAEARKEAGHTEDDSSHQRMHSWQNPWDRPLPAAPAPPQNPLAVELPAGDDMYYQTQSFRPGAQHASEPYDQAHRPSVADQKYTLVSEHAYPPPPARSPPLHPAHLHSHSLDQSSSPAYSPRPSGDSYSRTSPPPLPPKTPVNGLPYPDDPPPASSPYQQRPTSPRAPSTFMNMGDLGRRLPYPDVEGPPPVVNVGNKPQVSR